MEVYDMSQSKTLLTFGTILLLIMAGSFSLSAECTGPVKNVNTGICYTTIQTAINAAQSGHKITVENGVYVERLLIDKAITLEGADRWGTMIQYNSPPEVVKITGSNVTIRNLGVYWTGSSGGINTGIKIETNDNVIENVIVGDCYYGIWVYQATGNIISDCFISTVFQNHFAVFIYGGSKNQVCGNLILSSADIIGHGIFLFNTSENAILGNTIRNHANGIYLYSSNYNLVYYNNFENNTPHAEDYSSTYNQWDNEYPLGGNYWDNHPCTDSDSDGICDDPYYIYFNSQVVGVDNYPLKDRWSKNCGNVNGSRDGVIDQDDIDYLVNFVFRVAEPYLAPVPRCTGDLNGDGLLTISDITILINHVHLGGPVPTGCSCY